MTMNNHNAYLSVTELSHSLKDIVEMNFFDCFVEGEISNLAFPQSGHVYFNLKDDQSVLRCVAWRTTASRFQGVFDQGAKIRLRGKLTLYAPRGEYQLVVSHVEISGVGDLFAEFETLKNELSKEGLFDALHKKTPPTFPSAIGIISSPSGAALQDALKVLKEMRPDISVVVYPCLVQGKDAAKEIINAIKRANNDRIVDVLLLIRGGGSIEDLWCFNDKQLAYTIFNSKLPIITGIGHETDVTIADFVADYRAPTPSVAAKVSVIDRNELFQRLEYLFITLQKILTKKIEHIKYQLDIRQQKIVNVHPERLIEKQYSYLDQVSLRFKHRINEKFLLQKSMLDHLQSLLSVNLMQNRLQTEQQNISTLEVQMTKLMNAQVDSYKSKLGSAALLLDSFSPLKVMARGYSITYKVVDSQERKMIQSITEIKKGDIISTKLLDGEIESTVI